jgi:hypothetical protein
MEDESSIHMPLPNMHEYERAAMFAVYDGHAGVRQYFFALICILRLRFRFVERSIFNLPRLKPHVCSKTTSLSLSKKNLEKAKK